MKAKQKNVRVFELEIESENQFFAFFEKNGIILKEYLLLLKSGATEAIKSYLLENGFTFLDLKDSTIKIDNKETKRVKEEITQDSAKEKSNENKIKESLVISKTIRSGEEIEHDADIIIFGRINSGAKIIGHKNVLVFNECNGLIECNGEFMLLKKINNGSVIFNGELLDNRLFESNNLKKVFIKDGVLEIKEI